MPTQFTLHDFIAQMNQVRALGPTATFLSYLPIPRLRNMIRQIWMSQGDIQKSLARMNAIYQAMTPAQQDAAEGLDATERREIAARASVKINDVSRFLRSFEQTRALMESVGSKAVANRILRSHQAPAKVLGLVTHDSLHR